MMKLVVLCLAVVFGAACGGGDAPGADAGPTDRPRGSPIAFTFQAIGERSFASFGWSGQVHNLQVPSGTPFGVKVTSCSGTGEDDGICSFEGPVDPNPEISPVQRRRCLNKMSATCSTDAECPADGTTHRRCVYIYDPPTGAPLPGLGGKIGACGWSYIPVAAAGAPPTIRGTLDLATGELNIQNINIFLPLNGAQGAYRGACMECMEDKVPNDGKKEGRCVAALHGAASDTGPDLGMPCDVHRFGTLPGFEGNYSLDCAPTTSATDAPPNIFGGTFTSAGVVRPISDQSPDCTDPRFAGEKCFCGMCPNLPKTCFSDGDCNGAKCGALPATCNLNPAKFNRDGTENPEHDPLFFDNQCRGAGLANQFAIGGNMCVGACNWNPDSGLGTCASKAPDGRDIRIGCYPHGKDKEVKASGRAVKQNGIYIADTGTAVCTPLIAPPVNAQLGLPGLTFQKRSFRIVPEFAK